MLRPVAARPSLAFNPSASAGIPPFPDEVGFVGFVGDHIGGDTMELFFLRHGDALPDGERPLSPRGREQTLHLCEKLAEMSLSLQAIHTSPLLRARQTAEVAGTALGLQPQVSEWLDAGATVSDIAQLVQGLGAHARVMLVGHEPDFSTIVGLLIGGGAVQMKKSGLARVECDKVAPGRGTLKWLVTPDLVE
jgi:phosphohistidine phosphatase